MGAPPCSLAPPTLPVRTLGPGSGSVSLLRPGTCEGEKQFPVSPGPAKPPSQPPSVSPTSSAHPPSRLPLSPGQNPGPAPPPASPSSGSTGPGAFARPLPQDARPPCTQDRPVRPAGAAALALSWSLLALEVPGRSSSSRPLFSPRPPEIAASRVPAALPTDVTRCPAAAEIAAEGIPPPPVSEEAGHPRGHGGPGPGPPKGSSWQAQERECCVTPGSSEASLCWALRLGSPPARLGWGRGHPARRPLPASVGTAPTCADTQKDKNESCVRASSGCEFGAVQPAWHSQDPNAWIPKSSGL